LIITKTPLRISFLGGGTDYPEHFRQHGGQTLAVTINKYSYVIVNPLAQLFDYKIRVSYSRTELVSAVEEVRHPAVRGCLQYLNLPGNMEIHYIGDLPARSGLGSSSSFTVGFLHALHAVKGELVSTTQLAEEAICVEQQLLNERVGVQDQYTCALGGLRHLTFSQDGQITANPVPLANEQLVVLQNHLMLFYTGINRYAHQILDEQIERTKQGTNTNDLHQMSNLVDQGLDILMNGHSISAFGELLHNGWVAKRRLSSKISTSLIDDYYQRARLAGAIGGKLLGAGGGGFLLLFVPPPAQERVKVALNNLTCVDFSFENHGSALMLYHPQSHRQEHFLQCTAHSF
jgi:D-glycero-alpha-D-manno-heptose-7-phosphate kinase